MMLNVRGFEIRPGTWVIDVDGERRFTFHNAKLFEAKMGQLRREIFGEHTMLNHPTVSRRGFIGTAAAALAALVLPLPQEFLANAENAAKARQALDGWVMLLRPCVVPQNEVRGRELRVTPIDIAQLGRNFTKPIPLTVDFDFVGGHAVGWVSEVKVIGDALMARLELPSFNRALVKEYQAVVPAFLSHARNDAGKDIGTLLVAAALTNAPAVPDAHSLHV